MRYRLFQYPLPTAPELEDLNAFIASQRVATVTQHLVSAPGGAMLVFVVETVGSPSGKPVAAGDPKVDYREKLSPSEFLIYSRLREERKKWAEAEGLPVYTVFTNAQLAAMVQMPSATLAELSRVEGIGQARLEKYGSRLLALLVNNSPSLPK